MAVIPFPRNEHELPDQEALAAQIKKLERREDDYSVRIVLDGDPLFFLRVEPPGGDALLFTDFKPGNALVGVLAHAIEQILRSFHHRGRLMFQNVYPSWNSDPVGAVELQRRILSLKAELSLLEGYDQETTMFRAEEERGKINLLVIPNR